MKEFILKLIIFSAIVALVFYACGLAFGYGDILHYSDVETEAKPGYCAWATSGATFWPDMNGFLTSSTVKVATFDDPNNLEVTFWLHDYLGNHIASSSPVILDNTHFASTYALASAWWPTMPYLEVWNEYRFGCVETGGAGTMAAKKAEGDNYSLYLILQGQGKENRIEITYPTSTENTSVYFKDWLASVRYATTTYSTSTNYYTATIYFASSSEDLETDSFASLEKYAIRGGTLTTDCTLCFCNESNNSSIKIPNNMLMKPGGNYYAKAFLIFNSSLVATSSILYYGTNHLSLWCLCRHARFL